MVSGYYTPTESCYKPRNSITAENVGEFLKKIIGKESNLLTLWLENFLLWLKNCNEYEIRGSSLLIVIDEPAQVFRCKLIDLSSF